MRVVFMGTPRFAAEILDELAEFHEIAAVYTRPDAVRGRGKALVPSPVKEGAERRGLPVRTPRTLRDAAVLSGSPRSPDVICVAACRAILPQGGARPAALRLPERAGACSALAGQPHRAGHPRRRRGDRRASWPWRRAPAGGFCVRSLPAGSRNRRLAEGWQPERQRAAHGAGGPRAATCAGWPRTGRWSPTRRSPKAS
ncbi:MAG: formyltransferase family protein [Coriobacteriaceae bacterium]